ncbi:hypothetical protein BJP37_19250 [Moorena bouillonii PNG]|uniref:Uncharacterized protein n=1 Tax=Moorena bouillonii PNG TaxID=568701 RepID=A0A1U7N4J7_9CYAN|nr:hypothetical protein BJP37_19250 [Moorena bouillonii PNG]
MQVMDTGPIVVMVTTPMNDRKFVALSLVVKVRETCAASPTSLYNIVSHAKREWGKPRQSLMGGTPPGRRCLPKTALHRCRSRKREKIRQTLPLIGVAQNLSN